MLAPSRLTLKTLDDYTRHAVRTWWADGLWDLAMAGFFALAAVWTYLLVRVWAFPSWTWPWPFTTREVVNPRQWEISLWALGFFPLILGYAWCAYKLVDWLKSQVVAPQQGRVRHPFWLPLESRAYLLNVGLTLLSLGLFIGLCVQFKNGPHFLSACFAVAPIGILFAVGRYYRLPRYQWLSLAGALGCLTLELLFTLPANYQSGPRSFVEVSPLMGNPALPCAMWAAACLISGLTGLYRTLRTPDEHSA
jgi:hypothetical protein